MQPLVKGEDSWSIGELVHAIIIICTFKSLAGIVYGCGVTEEIDFSKNDIFSSSQQIDDEEEIKDKTVNEQTEKITNILKSGYHTEETEQLPEQSFMNAETTESSSPQNNETSSMLNLSSSSTNNLESDKENINRYIKEEKYNLKHADFDVKSNSYNIFRTQDYEWKEDGFELVRRFLPDAATLLDEEFDHIYSMTYNR